MTDEKRPHPASSDLVRWFILVLCSAAAAFLLAKLHFTAGLLVAPLVLAAYMAVRGWQTRVHNSLFAGAQATIGLLMAQSLTLPVLHEITLRWPIYLLSVFAVIALSFSLGWILMRLRIMPGSTALWGSSPGAASAMTLLSSAFGADTRLVAFMLYLRVVLVVIGTSVVARFALHPAHFHPLGGMPERLPHADALVVPVVLAITLAASFINFPAAAMLLGLASGILAHMLTSAALAPSIWLLAPAYFVVGWVIGLRFTMDVVHHAARALPAVLCSSLILIGACAALAIPVARIAHTDWLSAYLATSPGGADSLAIIAASSPVDMAFVMTMQIARFIILLAVGPTLATWLAHRARHLDRP
ncbi:AbrB family transcriptional regulator [Brytella acorum]|uniref:AbrB family transcriptional regulator n=1 Tax=Brytella acorum TaxID=2959299 RepID=A0AA35XVR0_9PROT|nr:AbrB family transcriptional regulator [Brytella acorum]MDF3623578.1 AbrB family transcriptional regulator [Brytella acorum]CAI9120004.1 AbrB family transcriptional regulator [Brytella acorum]